MFIGPLSCHVLTTYAPTHARRGLSFVFRQIYGKTLLESLTQKSKRIGNRPRILGNQSVVVSVRLWEAFLSAAASTSDSPESFPEIDSSRPSPISNDEVQDSTFY